jgi:thiol-disulfide isomerase/thioredoxin
MNIKSIASLAITACLFIQTPSKAQPAGPEVSAAMQTQLQGLVQQVQTKFKSGKTSEADFADEFKTLDGLIASEKGAKTDEAALLMFMKAQLYLEVIKDTDKGLKLVQQIKADYPDTKYGKNADKILDSITKQTAARKIQDSLAVGSAFPDFSATDENGKPLSVGSLKGKVVLLDFWATWCPPCRAELPNVIKTYQKHHDQGFEVIGISLDEDRDKLDAFLKQQDGMTWPQYFDGQGWQNKLAAKYGVEAIPFAVLIGPDGKIIGKELRGDDLEDAVAKAVAKK